MRKCRADAKHAYKHKVHFRNTRSALPSPNKHQEASRLFLLLLGRTLDFCRTSESLLSVLALFAYIHTLAPRLAQWLLFVA